MINIDSIIRLLKIDLITGEPNPIIDCFNEWWSGLIVIETDVYHDQGGEFIYYYNIIPEHPRGATKQVMFYRDDNNHSFWCYYTFWNAMRKAIQSKHERVSAPSIEVLENVIKLLVDNTTNETIAIPDKATKHSLHKSYKALSKHD